MIITTTTMAIEAVLLIAILILDDRDESITDPSAISALKVLLPLRPIWVEVVHNQLARALSIVLSAVRLSLIAIMLDPPMTEQTISANLKAEIFAGKNFIISMSAPKESSPEGGTNVEPCPYCKGKFSRDLPLVNGESQLQRHIKVFHRQYAKE